MDIVVCIKRVPVTQEMDLEIDPSLKDIKRDMLSYSINEWDNYAVEEAIRIKENHGGSVTAITVGKEEDEEILRRALAMGADSAIRIDPGDIILSPSLTSRLLFQCIKDIKYDLILTGVQADDTNDGIVGVMLAELLNLPHSSVVTGVEVLDGDIKVRVELEGGLEEVAQLRLPALLTIQTGINEPRYVSIMGIRRASKKEIKVLGIEDLGLSKDQLVSDTEIEELSLPPELEGAEIIEGSVDEIAERIIEILKEKGVSI